jgi:5-methylcytosine-specific restriction endonuclease McrA
MKKSSSHYKDIADNIFSKIVRKKGLCIKCGQSQFSVPLECAHIVGRANIALRWDANNAIPLCRDCHRWAHDKPKLFKAWFKEKFPDRYAWIMLHKDDTLQLRWYDYEDLIKMLKKFL